MSDPEIILARIKAMQKYLQRLNQFKSLTLEEYLNDFDKQLITERLIQLCTESALDINKHILAKLGVLNQKETWKNQEYFLEATKQKILTSEVAEELAKAAGMRNLLVHQYLKIDSAKVFGAIEKCLIYYPLYIRQITTYIDSLEIDHE